MDKKFRTTLDLNETAGERLKILAECDFTTPTALARKIVSIYVNSKFDEDGNLLWTPGVDLFNIATNVPKSNIKNESFTPCKKNEQVEVSEKSVSQEDDFPKRKPKVNGIGSF